MIWHVLIAIWWSIAALLINSAERAGNDPVKSVPVIVFWPIFALIQLPAATVKAMLGTGRQMRQSLSDRSLLREFDAWLKDRDNGEESSK